MQKNFVNFGPLTKVVINTYVDRLAWTFSGDYISALGVLPLKLLHVLQPHKLYFQSDVVRRAA